MSLQELREQALELSVSDRLALMKTIIYSLEDLARQAVSETLALMEVCHVNRDILEAAFASNLRDFEDAVQLACAMASRLDAVITRNAQDFAGATLPILSASELLESLS
jgi:predicted nucleic acid-binding protein